MTWSVTWNPSAAPTIDGEALPNGFSEFQQDVTVQEIQAVNR
jgi:hypothetical protein